MKSNVQVCKFAANLEWISYKQILPFSLFCHFSMTTTAIVIYICTPIYVSKHIVNCNPCLSPRIQWVIWCIKTEQTLWDNLSFGYRFLSSLVWQASATKLKTWRAEHILLLPFRHQDTKQWLTHKRAGNKFYALIPLKISEVTCNPYKHSFYSFSWLQCRFSVTLKRTSVGRCCALFFSWLCRCFKAFL